MSEYKLPTVADLIAKLSTMDPTLPVILAKDEEGNGFETWGGDAEESLIDIDERDTTWHTPEQWAQEMAKPDSRFDPEDDAPPDIEGSVKRVVVVWP